MASVSVEGIRFSTTTDNAGAVIGNVMADVFVCSSGPYLFSSVLVGDDSFGTRIRNLFGDRIRSIGSVWGTVITVANDGEGITVVLSVVITGTNGVATSTVSSVAWIRFRI